jgi:hemerythrin-like domain-containing protein
MSHDNMTQQTLVENDLLQHLLVGLRSTLDWKVQGQDFSRKLSTLHFIAQCFQRHLERMMALEEHDGYMDMVAETCPRLARRVDALRSEHGQFRDAARRVVQGLERVTPADTAEFARWCGELSALVDRVQAHSKKEVALLQEAVSQDSGGEG